MITANQSWHQSAFDAFTASRRAHGLSFLSGGGGYPARPQTRPIRSANIANDLANRAHAASRNIEDANRLVEQFPNVWKRTSDASDVHRGMTYRGLLQHEAARMAHEHSYNHYLNISRTNPDEFIYSQAAEAASAHHRAALAHDKAARAAASQLRMNLDLHRAFKQSIRENPLARGPFADWLDEHGLVREAQRIRLDPTGHLSRLHRLHQQLQTARLLLHEDNTSPAYYPIRHITEDHRRAMRSSIRANRLGGVENNLQAVSDHSLAAYSLSQFRQHYQRFLPSRTYNIVNTLQQLHHEIGNIHQERARTGG